MTTTSRCLSLPEPKGHTPTARGGGLVRKAEIWEALRTYPVTGRKKSGPAWPLDPESRP